MGILERLALPARHRDQALSINDWAEYFSFGGNTYPAVQTTMGTIDREQVGFTSVSAFKGSGPVFSLVLARLQVFSQVRFQWTRFSGSQPTELFGTPELGVLERPWRGGTTSDLLARMEVYASAAGCAYAIRPRADRLSLLRPDRVIILMGSETDADDPSEAPDAEIIGFVHETSRGKMTFYGPSEVAYYAPIPDPDYRFLGMSWITPVIRDLQADTLATEHKARFFCNAATPNMAIKFDASIGIEKVKQFKELIESEHKGAFNAWKTLYLGGGADPVTVGNSFKDMDYAVIQGRAESRLASAAGVPPSWVGFAEGLSGSSLNAGNFNSARRRFSDGTMIHLWTSAATSLEVLLNRPSGATLWYDPRVPFMREDAGDLAAIQQNQAQTIVALVRDGFTPESAVAAVTKNDFTQLVHSGKVSVQLQEPGSVPAAGEQIPKVPAADAARATVLADEWDNDPIGDLDDETLVVLTAMAELAEEAGQSSRAWNPALHQRWPKGHPKAGQFRPMIDQLKAAILAFDPKKDKHPFENFKRPQLLKAAKARGIAVKRGESDDSIAAKLLADLGGKTEPPAPAKKPATEKAAKPAITKAPSKASDVEAGDFSGLKRVGPQAGSNKGGVFEAADGSRWYVKAQKSEAHARNEATASALYRAAGIDVPAVHRGSGLAELGDGPQTATRIIDGATSDLSSKLNDPDYVAAVRQGFAVDAWLANWDAVGTSMDNIVTADGKPHRVDVGGSLLFRAQGAPKGAAFGKSVVEWATLRDPDKAPQASKFFAGITPGQLQESVKLVANIKPAKIKQLVDDPDLAKLLIDRRTDLLARAKKAKPKVSEFDARAAKAATGQQALDAVPLRLKGSSIEGDVPIAWSDADLENSGLALRGYRGSDYSPINDSLRKGNPNEWVMGRVEGIDRAMSASKLDTDAVTYRGIMYPSKVFGDAWSENSVVGLTWTDPGYSSTTADKRVADEGFSHDHSDSALMRVFVPRGTSGVRLSNMAPPGQSVMQLDHEAELLLQRGLTFRIVADHGYDEGTQRRLIDVEVVPA